MAAKKSPPKKTRGRPSRYKEEYVEQVEKLSRLGATDVEMADFFGVSERTFNTWKKAHPQFLQSIKKGKLFADANVVDSLYHRALGYEHAAVKIMQYEGVPVVVDYTEHYPPDTAAAIFWLKNRQPKRWRDKPEPAEENDTGAVPVKIEIINARKRDS